jgi:hypothetical protein
MTEWQESKEMHRVWKESVMPTFPVLSWHFPGDNEKYHEKPVKTVDALAEIRIRHLPNRGQKSLTGSAHLPGLSTQTIPRPTQQLRSGRPGARRSSRKLELRMQMVNYMCISRKSNWRQTSNTLKPDRPQHDRSAACVIAQQYSTVTFASLHFHSHKEKFDARLKNVALFFKRLRNCLPETL